MLLSLWRHFGIGPLQVLDAWTPGLIWLFFQAAQAEEERETLQPEEWLRRLTREWLADRVPHAPPWLMPEVPRICPNSPPN